MTNDSNADASQPATSASGAGVAVQLTGLNLHADGRPLLANASALFPAGKVSLIVGCSGVGKSLLLKILAGLIDRNEGAITWSGQVERKMASAEFGGTKAVETSSVAVVFQNYALFDELSPSENVEIAIDHAATECNSRGKVRERAAGLLNQLGVPSDRPTSVLSGGQQQRLAIARAIAMETDVVLYDEPTSGLDAATAERVVDLVRTTQQRYQRTSIIVTHDFESLQRIADHIYVLNHTERTLDEIARTEWNQLRIAIGEPPVVDTELPASAGQLARVAQTVTQFLGQSGQGVEEVACLPWSLLPIWKSLRWGLRNTRHYVGLVAGPSACIYIMIAGVIIGFVSQDFIFRYLPFRQYTEPLLIENLLHATGFSLYRFLVPILCSILIAARSGAAVAADVGSKVYGNQIDAMKTIGMEPRRSLRTPILYAFLVGTPLLTLLSYAAASLTAAIAFLATHTDQGIAFWDAHFHKELRDPASVFFHGSGWLMAKLLCCAVGIGMIAWNCGSTPKKSSSEISNGVTRSILWSTLLVLAIHFVFSLLEFTAPE
jgi:ABC-type transporter Mla maintaining outer membrane lipid asymmetry ATPase subunit MlaF/ABC-type transporter Mla maintaining outer membrane lipid asymmetry permease subunit MlaE